MKSNSVQLFLGHPVVMREIELLEKYKQNFDVSSKGPSALPSRRRAFA
jgi:hypothetical protein